MIVQTNRGSLFASSLLVCVGRDLRFTIRPRPNLSTFGRGLNRSTNHVSWTEEIEGIC